MPKKVSPYVNFNKGMNDSASADTLSSDELVYGYNIDLQVKGGYSQRKGCEKAFNTPLGSSKIARLIDYPSYPLATCGDKLLKWDGTVLKSGLATPEIGYEFFTNSNLYFTDGTKFYVYNGTTVTEVSGTNTTPIARCNYIVQRGQRLYATGDPQNPNYIYYSNVGAPNNYDVASIIKTVSDDNDKIQCLHLFHQSLIIFKKQVVFAWTGWDPNTDARLDPVDVHIGTEAPYSVCKSENYLLYLGDDAIIALVGIDANQVSSMRVSQGLTELIRGITNRETAVGVYYKGAYYLACCNNGSGINNLVLKGHVSMAYQTVDMQGGYQRTFPWTVYKGWSVGSWHIGDDGDLYYGSHTTGMVYKAFQGDSDDGVAITSEVKHRFNLDDSFRVKSVKKIILLARQYETSQCSVELDLQFGYQSMYKTISMDESALWDGADWDDVMWDWVDIVKKEISISRKVDRLEVIVRHNNLNEPMTIYGFGIVYKQKKPKGVRTGVTNRTPL